MREARATWGLEERGRGTWAAREVRAFAVPLALAEVREWSRVAKTPSILTQTLDRKPETPNCVPLGEGYCGVEKTVLQTDRESTAFIV